MNCECNLLPHIFNIERQANQLKDRLEIINVKNENWIKLGKCRVCNQYWQLDEWDKYQTICAIKIDDPNGWQSYDDKQDRIRLLIDSRSGISDEGCIKAGCENKALKSLVYCPQHAYEIGLRE
jgi:hypothetical protein